MNTIDAFHIQFQFECWIVKFKLSNSIKVNSHRKVVFEWMLMNSTYTWEMNYYMYRKLMEIYDWDDDCLIYGICFYWDIEKKCKNDRCVKIWQSITMQCLAKKWIYLTTYVCTERIFDSWLFMYHKTFLKKILRKLVAHIFTLLLAHFASKLVN